MMSPDERIKELKKQGYISGVMAGKRIRARMNECLKNDPSVDSYKWNKLYQHLMDNAKKYVMCEAVTMNQGQTVRWYYNEKDLVNWIDVELSYI